MILTTNLPDASVKASDIPLLRARLTSFLPSVRYMTSADSDSLPPELSFTTTVIVALISNSHTN